MAAQCCKLNTLSGSTDQQCAVIAIVTDNLMRAESVVISDKGLKPLVRTELATAIRINSCCIA
jgi:hypothetical protein